MIRSAVLAATLFASATALAVPLEFAHQGRMLDSTGAALDGSHSVTFSLYDATSGGSAVWTETQSLEFTEGYFSAALGSSEALDASAFDGGTLYLGMALDGGAELSDRLPLASVPFAIRALSADGLAEGASLDVGELRVGGELVVDSDGLINADRLRGVSDTLSDLGCTDGQSVAFDGSAWGCSDAGDHAHSADDVTDGVFASARLPIGSGSDEVAAGNHSHTASDVGALPVGTTAADIGALAASALDGDVTVGGQLTIGTSSATCDGSLAGTLRWDDPNLEMCDGTEWRQLRALGGTDGSQADRAGTSCKQILSDYPGTQTGAYFIDPEGDGSSSKLWCDMDTDGGGWTRIALNTSGSTATWSCNNSNQHWATAQAVSKDWGDGGEVMSKWYQADTGAETTSPKSVVKFDPGPYKNIFTMFDFTDRGQTWEHENSGVFSLEVISGHNYSNNVYWNHGGNSNKADFCVGGSPSHGSCVYTGHSNLCGNVYNDGAWRSANSTNEIYIREP